MDQATREFLTSYSPADTPLPGKFLGDVRGARSRKRPKTPLYCQEDVNWSVMQIPAEGRMVELHIVRPGTSEKDLPGIVFFHGGGWASTGYLKYEQLMVDLVLSTGTAMIYVDYSLSPDFQYPIANQEAYGVLEWMSQCGHVAGIDGSRLAVLGDCTGGNMAVVVCLMAKSLGAPLVRLQMLLCPALDGHLSSVSYEEFATGFYLTRYMMEKYWESYLPPGENRDHIYVSPVQATSDQLAGLPPTLIITAEMDVLRDEGEAFAAKLSEAGVDVTSKCFPGVIHDFCAIRELSHTPQARNAVNYIANCVKKHLC